MFYTLSRELARIAMVRVLANPAVAAVARHRHLQDGHGLGDAATKMSASYSGAGLQVNSAARWLLR